MLEALGPRRRDATATRLGPRPGFALDLTAPRPYGLRACERWNLDCERDRSDLDELLEYEKPFMLVDNPACNSYLDFFSEAGVDCSGMRAECGNAGKGRARRSAELYRKQVASGPDFLPERCRPSH